MKSDLLAECKSKEWDINNEEVKLFYVGRAKAMLLQGKYETKKAEPAAAEGMKVVG